MALKKNHFSWVGIALLLLMAGGGGALWWGLGSQGEWGGERWGVWGPAVVRGETTAPLVGATLPAVTDPKQFTVLVVNVRLPMVEDKGPKSWPERREVLLESIGREQADLIGMQEVSPAQGVYLVRSLKGYAYVPVGENEGGVGGILNDVISSMNLIFYRADRWTLVEASHGALRTDIKQKNPAEEAYYTLAVLRDLRRVLSDLVVINTHLRHGSANAVVCAGRIHELLAQELKGRPGAQGVVLGDMNHGKGSAVYKALVGAKEATELRDTFDYTRKKAGEKWGTWHNFTGKSTAEWPTDLILATPGLQWKAAEMVRPPLEAKGVYPTDHFLIRTRFGGDGAVIGK